MSGGERLEWYGVQLPLSGLQQRTIGDEVALDALPWLNALGVQVNRSKNTLKVELPQPHLKTLRQGKGKQRQSSCDGPQWACPRSAPGR